MKKRTIAKVIKTKFDSWIGSITDPTVKQLAKDGTIVTGGCIASMLLQEKVNDFDIYFKDKATCLAVAKYYVGKFKVKEKKGIPVKIFVEHTKDRVRVKIQSAGIASEDGSKKPYEYFESKGEGEAEGYVSEIMKDPSDIEEAYEKLEEEALKAEDTDFRPIFMSTNAITLSGKVQLILRFFGNPEDIHENYDFVHCTNYWTSWDNNVVLKLEAMEALMAKELIYVGSKYPICSIFRIRKFLKRNFTIGAGQILKICLQISELDLTDIEVLQDQLTGVDCAYFTEVLEKLKAKDPNVVNTAYLIEVINRMF